MKLELLLENNYVDPERVKHIDHYREDLGLALKKVCRVLDDGGDDPFWHYTDIDYDLMYSEHRSWVYMITVDGRVEKIGETGRRLGIEGQIIDGVVQPKFTTECRLGRYRRQRGSPKKIDTDHRCRQKLREDLRAGKLVEFWAWACPVTQHEFQWPTARVTAVSLMQQDMEKLLIEYYQTLIGQTPRLNVNVS